MGKTCVLVADGHTFFRSGLTHGLKHQPALAYCGEADSVEATGRAVAKLRPEIILPALLPGDGHGIDFIRELTETHPTTQIIVLSQCDEDTYPHRALRAGARGLPRSE